MFALILESVGTAEIILLLIALFIVVISIGIIFLVVKIAKKSQSKLKKCAFCAEMIQSEAIVCRYCGRDLVK